MIKNKFVTWRELSIGQEVQGWKEGHSHHMAHATVQAKNAAYVTLLVFGRNEERVSSEGATFEVEMTEQEFRQRYQTQAEALVRDIQTELPSYSIGEHEMWNAWITYDPYTMAATCQAYSMRVTGHCKDILPKQNLFDSDLILDIGICAEYEDGDKIWCHASMESLRDMLAQWESHKRAEAPTH